MPTVVMYSDTFSEYTRTAIFAVIGNRNLALFARHNGLKRVFRYGTATRSIGLMDDEWCFTYIGEYEFVSHYGSVLCENTEVVTRFFKSHFAFILWLHFVLCKAYKCCEQHCCH